jgi:transcriptional regulator with XRE-family HTH domain
MLRRARVEAGLTQRQVGDCIGVAQSDVSNYERGRSQPARRRLVALAELLGLDIDPDEWWLAGMKRRPKGPGLVSDAWSRAVSGRSSRSEYVRATTSPSGRR